jgi:pimeloyl-ACP methyl ester carboxylesterase/tellurite resistance protein
MGMPPFGHFAQQFERTWERTGGALAGLNQQQQLISRLGLEHADRIRSSNWTKLGESWKTAWSLAPALANPAAAQDWPCYLRDAAERWVLYIDALRERGNSYIEREAEGFKPVLVFEYETICDGRKFERPVNYALVRIKPRDGDPPQREDGRPFVIIDPRAGHGSGIGGYKSDSEVGVALRDGHPVYFAIFYPNPEPGQTLADVCAAEAVFLREVLKRHPAAPKPLIIGNCQGGWAAMLLAATNPDLPGPLVIAGGPLSYWAGTAGRNPLRYLGGLFGGTLPALLACDLADGRFDGANLVLNFEHLNPANTWWRKYYDLFAKVDEEAARFLEFERWWSGFYFMNEVEIRWILENLFIGNKLVHGTAVFDDGQEIDLRRIKSPIVIFASHGDNITPPEQALYWVADLYGSTKEIVARGQVIIYTLHQTIGHLGIFVSASVAQKQHKQITSTVKTIEALAPGLYEMLIEERPDRVHVSFEGRELTDILALGQRGDDEAEFAAVSRLSEWASETYELTLRPWIRSAVTSDFAQVATRLHPLRQRRYFFSERNPLFSNWGDLADCVRTQRSRVSPGNPFLGLEHLQAQWVDLAWEFYCDARNAAWELIFHGVYGQPWMKQIGKLPRARPGLFDFRQFPEIRQAIERAAEGGYAEAVIRMLVLMARSRGSVRRSRLERSNRILQSEPPFAEMSTIERSRIIHEQTLITEFAPEKATSTLERLIPAEADRQKAIDLVLEVAGPLEEMSPPTIAMLEQLQFLLDVKASKWQEPEYDVTPFRAGNVPPARATEAAELERA